MSEVSFQASAKVEPSCVLVNSDISGGVVISENCCLSHSRITRPLKIGAGSLVNGVFTIGLDVK